MKHKVSDLDGALLDAAVAMADPAWHARQTANWHFAEPKWSPSRVWGDAGPLVERERIALAPWVPPNDSWAAWIDASPGAEDSPSATGETPLIAAMRAFVASKFGDEVELP